MDIRKVFGGNLRRFRLADGLSQEALANRMGVDRAHVGNMERGKQNATLVTLWEVAQALKRQPVEFLDEEGAASAPPTDVKAPRRKRTKA